AAAPIPIPRTMNVLSMSPPRRSDGSCRLPGVTDAPRRGMGCVRPVHVAHYERARLRDAVDDGRVEGEIVYPEGFVEIGDRRRQPVGRRGATRPGALRHL